MEIEVKSSEVLRQLFMSFDDFGFAHRYSEDLGEFDIKVGDKWFTFYVNKRVLDEERAHDEAFEDAARVADYYWRQ